MAGTKTSSFLDLPPELRNKIYEHSLEDSGNIKVVRTQTWSTYFRRDATYQLHPRTRLNPALLATNRQVYSEAIGYLYGQDIAVPDIYAVRDFLLFIGPRNLEYIPRIILSDVEWDFFLYPDSLAEMVTPE